MAQFRSGSSLKKYIADTDWAKDRRETERKFQAGKITDFERGVSNVAGSVEAALTPVNYALEGMFGMLPDVVQKTISETAQDVGEAVQDTSLFKAGAELARQNPRTAEFLGDVGKIASVVPVGRIVKSSVNEPVLAMNTMIPENYSGLPGAEIYGSAKTFAKTLPTAVKDAFSPSAQAALRETGISPSKAAGEIGSAVRTGNQSFGSAITSSYLSRQTGRGESIVEKGPIGKANFHGNTKASDKNGLKSAIFVDNKTTRGAIPAQVQERAFNHLIKSTGVEKQLNTTDVYIKRNSGYDNFGSEGVLGTAASNSNPVMSALNSNSTIKGSLSEWVKNNKVPRGKKTDESSIESARKSLSPKDMEEYFQYYNKVNKDKTPVNFRKGEKGDDFYYFQSSHNSRAKELGGVNMFFALNPKSGQLITMMTDKHDLVKMNPAGGTSLVTVSPAQVSNFKADKGKRFTINSATKQKQSKAKKDSEELAAKELERTTGIKREKNETPVSYHFRVMRDYRPQAELQDYSKVLKRGGMLGVVGTSAAAQAEEGEP